jgi:hypothetical protein
VRDYSALVLEMRQGRARLEPIAFGSMRPIVAALAERSDAVNDRVHNVRSNASKPEASPVVLRGDGHEAQEAAAHCLLRTEAATLGDPFDGQARLRQEAPRGFDPQPFDGAGPASARSPPHSAD